MDKFIVRRPRSTESDTDGPSTSKPRMIQATIESLKGVVVVEEVRRLKSVLRLPGQSTTHLLDALDELNKKIPPQHILRETKIGHTINRLTKHEDKEVALRAATTVKNWKKFFEDKMEKPLIEVKCDKNTEALREAGRKHLLRAMTTDEEPSSGKRLAEVIEREAFLQHGRLVDKLYRRSMRTLVFTLQHQEQQRSSVLCGQITAKDFVAMHKKSAGKKS